jgi:hypothetical protein
MAYLYAFYILSRTPHHFINMSNQQAADKLLRNLLNTTAVQPTALQLHLLNRAAIRSVFDDCTTYDDCLAALRTYWRYIQNNPDWTVESILISDISDEFYDAPCQRF